MRENSVIKQRILQYAVYKGISRYEIYKKTGITNGVLSQSTGISEENILKFLSYFKEVSPDWLIIGKEPMIKEHNHINAVQENKETHQKRAKQKGVPMITLDAFAGTAGGEIKVMDYECDRYIVPGCEKCDFLIPIKGDSMLPRYVSGDIVGCRHVPLTDIFFQWNKVYVLDTTQGALIKRINKGSDKNHILLVSDNGYYGPFELPITKINAIALVVCLIKPE